MDAPVAGRVLTQARFNAGLTKKALAKRVGVTPHTIARLEDGDHPSPQTAKSIADFFGLKPTDIWPIRTRDLVA